MPSSGSTSNLVVTSNVTSNANLYLLANITIWTYKMGFSWKISQGLRINIRTNELIWPVEENPEIKITGQCNPKIEFCS